jgi:ribosomal protein S3
MYYNYNLYSFNKFFNYLKINKKKNYLKMKDLYKNNSFIMGYKMSLKGRFTRKQRASSIWFHQGFVPLNTVKAVIDYAFFTIPLKNSAISIKLWLYKNIEVMH